MDASNLYQDHDAFRIFQEKLGILWSMKESDDVCDLIQDAVKFNVDVISRYAMCDTDGGGDDLVIFKVIGTKLNL